MNDLDPPRRPTDVEVELTVSLYMSPLDAERLKSMDKDVSAHLLFELNHWLMGHGFRPRQYGIDGKEDFGV